MILIKSWHLNNVVGAKGRPANGQDDGIQMDACMECLHVANSHLPVNLEPWEMWWEKKEERMRKRREENDKNC